MFELVCSQLLIDSQDKFAFSSLFLGQIHGITNRQNKETHQFISGSRAAQWLQLSGKKIDASARISWFALYRQCKLWQIFKIRCWTGSLGSTPWSSIIQITSLNSSTGDHSATTAILTPLGAIGSHVFGANVQLFYSILRASLWDEHWGHAGPLKCTSLRNSNYSPFSSVLFQSL